MAIVYVAFYKGKAKPGSPWHERLKYFYDGVIRLFTRSPYSHCELAIPDPKRVAAPGKKKNLPTAH